MADSATFIVTSGTPNNIPANATVAFNVNVSGMDGPVTGLTVHLDQLTHPDMVFFYVLLIAPDGSNLILFARDGVLTSYSNESIIFTDRPEDDFSRSARVFKPSDTSGVLDADDFGLAPFELNHPAPAPGHSETLASAFNGIDPNGTWSLYVRDADGSNGGGTLGSVSLNLVTNIAPEISAPAQQSVLSGGTLTFSAANGTVPTSIDPDAGPIEVRRLTLSVEHGLVSGGGSNISPRKISEHGFLEDDFVQSFFEGLVYTPDAGFSGVDHLTIKVTDGGGLRGLGSLTTTKTIDIEVFVHPDATDGDDSFTASGSQKIDGGAGKDTITFDFGLTQAIVTYDDNTVTIEAAGTKTVVSGCEKFVFNDGTVDNADGSPLVDDLFYYTRSHDVWAANVDADTHYNTFGWHEGRDPNAFFSTVRYLDAYDDVQAADINPLAHYDAFGWKEDRDPSVRFDTSAYLAANPDVAAAQIDPLLHFLLHGHQESRHAFEILTY
jgi:hypothetical protein